MEKRLYCIIRGDLKPGQKIAQACHAATQYLLDNPNTTWDNGFIICLETKDEQELRELREKLILKEKIHSIFEEPDMNNSLTSISALDCGKTFANLKLSR